MQRITCDGGEQTHTVRLQFSSQAIISKSFSLGSPPRVVIDVPPSTYDKSQINSFASRCAAGAIKNIRAGQFDSNTTRFVFDLSSGKVGWKAQASGNNIILTTGSVRVLKNSGGNVQNVPVPVARPSDAAKEAAKPVVVIDAGHGGKDPGSQSHGGLREKDITLKYARSLRDALLRTGRYKVALTRDGDSYLFLKERVKVARSSQGHIFISLHADANPNADASGLSVYTLSEKASDDEAAALARQENKADIVGGLDLSHEDQTVADILIDLAQRETNNKSSKLADTIIDNMHPKIPLLTNAHRYAGFRVLKAPDIPSVLIEIGFMTNSADVQRIQTREYRDKLVRSLVSAIDGYFKDQ